MSSRNIYISNAGLILFYFWWIYKDIDFFKHWSGVVMFLELEKKKKKKVCDFVWM